MPPNYVHFFCVVDAHVKVWEESRFVASPCFATLPALLSLFDPAGIKTPDAGCRWF